MAQLPNYLRSHRKRAALSQDEAAFLLGSHGGAKVCRYERFVSEPSLSTALAFEAMYQKPVRELFAGLYQRIERNVSARAKTLIYQTDRGKPGRRTARKRQALASIISSETNIPNQP